MYHDLIFFVPEHSTNFEKAKDKNSRKQMVTNNYVCLYTGGDWFKQYYFIRGVLIHVLEILSKHIYMLCSPLLIKVWKRARAVVGSTLGIIYYRNRIMLLKVANPWDISKLDLLRAVPGKNSCDDWKRLQKIIVMSQGLKVFKVSEALERLLLQVFMNHMDESAQSFSNVHYLTSDVPEATLPSTVPALLVLVTAQCLLNQFSLRVSLDVFDLIMYDNRIRLAKKGIGEERLPEVLLHKYTLCALLIVMAVALLLINRQMEVTSRLLFVWKETVEEQKAQVEDMRHKNEALVYNILPPHVAKHFLGAKKKDEELYSLSYDSVGVLFASMPNFSDFYTEETVNNQGIECLRFLNEVISDYDALLEQPAFRDITKIKTIGSTYMAASGLKSENEIPNSDKEKCHLAVLTEFALALRRTLNGINEQSFNNFILRIGINHGPITAGVIGARKPHYDVWGNTVNVASRMESTGKAGSIQVVEETKNILENFGYGFEQRGLVSVKGKGKLMTYYLIGKESKDDKSNSVPNSLST
ncbi:Adenylate cyclase type 3 [Nymphon striatum]|nr:Adenylate cyclase type 3 [Nymphon striatum]